VARGPSLVESCIIIIIWPVGQTKRNKYVIRIGRALTVWDDGDNIVEISFGVGSSSIDAAVDQTDVRPEHITRTVAVRQTDDPSALLVSTRQFSLIRIRQNYSKLLNRHRLIFPVSRTSQLLK